MKFEVKNIRKVQALSGERSYVVVLPKMLAIEMNIGKGDFLKYYRDGKSLILEKVDVQ